MSKGFNRFKKWTISWIPDKNKVQFFLIFVIISTLFWLLTRFSNSYSGQVVFDVAYFNIPKEIVVESAPEKVAVTIEASGFQLLLYQVFGSTLNVNLQNAQLENEKGYVNLIEQQTYLESQLADKTIISLFTPSQLGFQFKRLVQKKIPIRLTSDIAFKTGYNYQEPPALIPDSITLLGPRDQIAGIQFVNTQLLEKSSLEKDFSETLRLQIPEGVVSLSNQVVIVNAKITQFTELTFNLPVQVNNNPSGTKIRLFPKEVQIRVLVPMSLAKNVLAQDFNAAVDFQEMIEKSDKTIKVSIVKQSPFVQSIRLEPKFINYLIKE